MDSIEDVTQFLESFFQSITSDNPEELSRFMDPNVAVTLPQSAYRFDTLASFARSNIAFNQMGGRVVNADVRQVRVDKLGDCMSVSCYFAQRVEIGDRSVGKQGKATAFVNDQAKLVSLHISEVTSSSGFISSGSSLESSRSLLGETAEARRLLDVVAWGCE